MKIKCIALDLDGTTLDADGRLSPGNRQALELAIQNGIQVIVASGRAFDTLPEDILKVQGIVYAVTSNGAAMYHVPTGECLHRYRMQEEDVQAILEAMKHKTVTYEAFVDGVAYAGRTYIENPGAYGATPKVAEYVRRTRHPVEDIVEFMEQHRKELDCMDVIIGKETDMQEIWHLISRCTKECYMTTSAKRLIEISHQKAGKHSGLKYFMKLLGLKREEIAAFGDADNDVEMLEYAGCSVAMENASAKCKEAADYITKHHAADGVAYGLKEILKII